MFVNAHTDSPKDLPSGTAGKGLILDDHYLWQNFRKDNELAFSMLYNKYTPKLFNYGMHYCADRDLVLDCLQELFSSFWAKRKTLPDVYSISSYLFKSFRRLLLKKLNWRRRFLISLDTNSRHSFEITLPFEHTLEQQELETERSEMLKRNLQKLTRRQREALFLKFYNDLNYADIASIMELQVDSVYNIISKALDSLRQEMKA